MEEADVEEGELVREEGELTEDDESPPELAYGRGQCSSSSLG